MSKEFEISRVIELPNIYIHDGPESRQKALQQVHLSKSTLEAYHDALNPRLPFRIRFKRFLQAENEAGRIAKMAKDFALIFTPYGQQINTLTDFVTEQFIQPEQNEEQNMNWFIERAQEKSTWRGIVAVVTAAGIAFTPEQSAAIVALGVAIAGTFEVFFKEPQSKDA